MTQDDEHLRLLSIFHYVLGGLSAVFSCFALFYVGLGLVFLFVPATGKSGEAPPAFVGWFVIAIGAVLLLAGWAFAAGLLYAGRCLAHRVHHTYCLVMAALACMVMPLGTVLGVFTLIVLLRPSVRALFGVPQPVPPPAPAG